MLVPAKVNPSWPQKKPDVTITMDFRNHKITSTNPKYTSTAHFGSSPAKQGNISVLLSGSSFNSSFRNVHVSFANTIVSPIATCCRWRAGLWLLHVTASPTVVRCLHVCWVRNLGGGRNRGCNHGDEDVHWAGIWLSLHIGRGRRRTNVTIYLLFTSFSSWPSFLVVYFIRFQTFWAWSFCYIIFLTVSHFRLGQVSEVSKTWNTFPKKVKSKSLSSSFRLSIVGTFVPTELHHLVAAPVKPILSPASSGSTGCITWFWYRWAAQLL